MEGKFFYTYMENRDSLAFCRGYNNGKRFSRVYGGYPDVKVNINLPEIEKLKEENKKFKYFTDKIYVTKKTFEERQRWFLLALSNSTVLSDKKYNCKFNETDKTDLFGEPMIEIEHPINQNIDLVKFLKGEGIDVYDEIDTSVKIRNILKSSPRFEIDYNQIKIAFLDIETETEHGGIDTVNVPEKINVITVKIKGGKIYTWCLGEYNNTDPDTDIEVKTFTNEREMLKDFIKKWRELDVDVISDWNGTFFDIPYICNRIRRLLGWNEMNRLSPFNIVKSHKRKNRFGKEFDSYDIIGINHLDYMELYLSFNHTPRDSYSLNNICQAEIGKGKLDYSEFGTLGRLYKGNFQKFVDYNIRDVTIIEELDDKLQMIHLALSIAYMCSCHTAEVLSQIRTWDCFIYSDFQSKGLVLPPKRELSETERGELMGGYVKLPETGIYSNIVSFDVNSLYPTIIRQLNLSPETITDEVDENFKDESTYSIDDDLHRLGALIDCTYDTSYLKEKNLCLSCNGNLIKRDKQGFLPKMVGDLYNNRVVVKKKMKKAKQELQLVIKEIEKREGK